MNRIQRIAGIMAACAATVVITSDMHAQEDLFVRIAPCRVLNTATKPADDAGEENERRIDVRASRCGRIIPPFATAYSVRVTTVSREAPEKLPPGVGPVTEASRKIPVPALTARLAFPIPGNRHVAVDIEGYYVPAGTPLRLSAVEMPAQSEESSVAARPQRPGSVSVNELEDGSHGDIYLDATAPGLPEAGVALVATAGKPWVVAQTGTSTAASGFQVVNAANQALLTVGGGGRVRLPSRAGSFFDGATDFFGDPDASWYPTLPMNTIHDVTLLSPRDSAGGSTSPVVFFNAETTDESGSPAITKYRAFTLGFYGQNNVNYDSVIEKPAPFTVTPT